MQEFSYGIIPLRRQCDLWEVLLVQHPGGHWSFPKGHAEEGESSKETAERELFEETGLKVAAYLPSEALFERYSFRRRQQWIFKEVRYFPAEVEGEVVLQKDELRDFRWFSLKNAEKGMTFPQGQRLCQAMVRLLCY